MVANKSKVRCRGGRFGDILHWHCGIAFVPTACQRLADKAIILCYAAFTLTLGRSRQSLSRVFNKTALINYKIKRPGIAREWYAEVHPQSGKAIVGRLCALLLPPDKAEEARQRARREQGRSVTEETLAAAQYVVVFTTVPSARLTAALVMELYGLRRQIELHIKRDKSIAGLDRLPNFRSDTVYSWICAKLLLTQIA